MVHRRSSLTRSATTDVLLLAVVLFVFGIVLIWSIPDLSSPIRLGSTVLPLVVAVLFGISVIAVFHVEFRREAFSFTMSEVPVAIAVIFLAPVGGVLARLAGATVALLIFRKPPPFKLFFNLSAFTAEIAIAYVITHALLRNGEPSVTKIVLVVAAATIAASVAGSVAVSALPIFPNTDFTSGNVFIILSVCCKSSFALVTEIPGKVVGMYSKSPSYRGGINSEPSFE